MSFYGRYPGMGGGGGGGGVSSLNTLTGALTLVGGAGIAITDNGTNQITISATGGGDVTLAPFGTTPNANAATLVSQVLNLEPASASFPGGVSTTTQSFAGAKTFVNQLNADGGIDRSTSGTLTIGATNSTIINIGNSGATVNIQGTTIYENTPQLLVADPLITVNSGGGAGSGQNAGIQIEEAASITGYAETSADRNSWIFKAPNTAGIVTVTPGASGFVINQGSHDPVTLGTANGLSLVGQVLSLGLSSTSTTGALSSTDWNTFNSKQSSSLTSAHILVGNGSNIATDVAMTGDIAITNAGVTSYSGVVPNNKTTGVVTPTASTLMLRDASANSAANILAQNFATTVTASGTTTLTAASAPVQRFTGTAAQTLRLPDATTLLAGTMYSVINRATGGVSVQTTTASVIQMVASGINAWITLTDNSTAAGTWDVVLNDSPGIDPTELVNYSLLPQQSAGALTVSFRDGAGATASTSSPIKMQFINPADLVTGALKELLLTGASSVTAPSGSTLGLTSGATSYVYVYAIDSNAATAIEVVLSAKGDWDESVLQSTTAITSGATSATTLYSTTARTNRGIRLVGRMLVVNTAGTWSTPTAAYNGFVASKLDKFLTSANIWVGSSSNVAASVAASGDLTLANTGAFTLATVNSNVGSFGSATQVGTFTVNGKGLITAASNTSIQITESQVTNLTTDLAAKQSTTLTSAHILVGNGSNVATDVAMTGDISITNAGVTAYAGTVPVTKGGTNITSYTKGDILAASGASTLVAVPVGANNLMPIADSSTSSGLIYAPAYGLNTLNNLGVQASVNSNTLIVGFATAAGQSQSSTDFSTIVFPSYQSAGTDTRATTVRVTSQPVITVPNGATLGHRSAVSEYIYVYAINNAGTAEVALSSTLYDTGLSYNTTAIDTASDSATGIYSTTARTGVAMVLIGRILISEATAGTWATNPTKLSLWPFRLENPSGNLTAITRYTSSSGTFTPDPRTRQLRIRMIGAGAGGTGGTTVAANNAGPGGAGGDTTFGTSLLTAKGAPASAVTATGPGGVAGTVNSPAITVVNAVGGGGVGSDQTSTGDVAGGGSGGYGYFGGGGAGQLGAGTGVVGGANTGGGGAGGRALGVAYGGTGGGSGNYVEAIINAPNILASYSYAVGAGGAGGTAGTGGEAGGAGAAGIIIIEEVFSN